MMNGARLHADCERRLTTAQRILLYVAVYLAWEIFPGVGNWIRGAFSEMLWDLMRFSNPLYLLVNMGINILTMLVLLAIMHKVVFFCKEKPWPVIKPVVFLYAARYAGLALAPLLLGTLNGSTHFEFMQLARELGGISVILGMFAAPALVWWVVLSFLRSELLEGQTHHRGQHVIFVLALAAIEGLCMQMAVFSGLLSSGLITLLTWAVDAAGLLLVLWKVVYPERMDTALPAKAAAKGDAKRILSVDLEDIEKRNEQQERMDRRMRFGLDDNDDGKKKRRGLFDRYDLDNNDERVIAQSSRDAIRVMEHHELEMKHEWNCDDEKGDHHQ